MKLSVVILFGLSCLSVAASRQYNSRTRDEGRSSRDWTRPRHLDSSLNQRQNGSIMRRLSERVRESRMRSSDVRRRLNQGMSRRGQVQTNFQNGPTIRNSINFDNSGTRLNNIGRFENRNTNSFGIRDNRFQGRTTRNNRDPIRNMNGSRNGRTIINDNSVNRLRNNFINRSSATRNGGMVGLSPSRVLDRQQLRRRMMTRNNRM